MKEALTTNVDSLRNIFAILLALALGEAFKQFVADRAEKPDEPSLRWDSLPAIASFLLLMIPFYHGMARYLYDVYKVGEPPTPYGAFLLFDVAAFTVEAALFFVMSRAVRKVQWRRFYFAVVFILVTDTVWGLPIYFHHRKEILPWLILNAVFLPVFLLLVWRNPRVDSKARPIFAMLAMIVRTVADYGTSWEFYFPG